MASTSPQKMSLSRPVLMPHAPYFLMSGASTGSRRMSTRRARAMSSAVIARKRRESVARCPKTVASQRSDTVSVTRAWISIVDGSTGVATSRSTACAAMRIIGRGGSTVRLLFDAHDAIDGRARARRRRIGARARVGDRLPQRVALERGAIAHVESNARNRRRAAGGGRVDDDADAIDVVEPHFDGVARDVVAKRLPPVGVVEFGLQLVADRADRILWHAGLLDFLQHRRHRGGVLLLRIRGILRARFGGNRHERAVGPRGHDRLAARHNRRLQRRDDRRGV